MATIQEILTRGVAEILPTKEGLEALMRQKKMRLYVGIDPTGKNLHLGHTIGLSKLQQFADLGHESILLVGTGTVLAGDPSQRDKARPKITPGEIEENMKTWKEQASKVLDFTKVQIRYNGDWLLKLGLADILEITSHISAARLFERDMFQRRLAQGDTVRVHEFLYPLLQGYDSVAMDVDLEIGATDQTFNMLMGRELQQKMKGKEKFVLTTPMIAGLDGKPMSKTSGNTVNISDTPEDMYGKLMSLRDELIGDYFELCTNIEIETVKQIKEFIARETKGDIKDFNLIPKKLLNNRDLKAWMAKTIVVRFHGEKEAEKAEREFQKVFQKKELPSDIPEIFLKGESLSLGEVLVRAKLAPSKAMAKRLIDQGGVKIDGKVQEDVFLPVPLKKGTVLQVGKRKWVKLS